jgi:hypothetical protein
MVVHDNNPEKEMERDRTTKGTTMSPSEMMVEDNEVEKLEEVVFAEEVPSSNSSVVPIHNNNSHPDDSQYYEDDESPVNRTTNKQVKRHLDFSGLFDNNSNDEETGSSYEPVPKKRFTTPFRIPSGNDLILSSMKKPLMENSRGTVRPVSRPLLKRKHEVQMTQEEKDEFKAYIMKSITKRPRLDKKEFSKESKIDDLTWYDFFDSNNHLFFFCSCYLPTRRFIPSFFFLFCNNSSNFSCFSH